MVIGTPSFVKLHNHTESNLNTNSKMAYQSLLMDGTINFQEKVILDCLSDGVKRSSRQIAKATELERSSVVGRLNSLKKKFLVTWENDTCPTTGKTVEFYGVV